MDEALAAAIDRALGVLDRGGVIVYPTETFYGLGADATSPDALERLADLKARDRDRPVSVLVSSRRMLDQLVTSVPAVAERLIDELWPGALTIAFAARPHVARRLTGGSGTIAARMSSHPVARALVERFGRPLTATSANPGGSPAPADAAAARAYFGSRVGAYVDSGPTAGAPASTVLDCSTESLRLIREGSIPVSRIEAVTGMRVLRE